MYFHQVLCIVYRRRLWPIEWCSFPAPQLAQTNPWSYQTNNQSGWKQSYNIVGIDQRLCCHLVLRRKRWRSKAAPQFTTNIAPAIRNRMDPSYTCMCEHVTYLFILAAEEGEGRGWRHCVHEMLVWSQCKDYQQVCFREGWSEGDVALSY
jgi:hypothetical protein